MRGLRLASLAFVATLATPALAGNYADRVVLGFSPDARFFAFAEYGVQDGSGFPFANAYVIDTTTDSWVPGTPVRVMDQEDGAPLNATLSKAVDGIRALVEQHQIATPPVVVAHNPLTEISADPHVVSFLRRMTVPPDTSAAYTLTLSEKPLPAAGCPDMGRPFMGFRLMLTTPSGQEVALADDGQIPSSRKCPLGYRISEVMVAPGSLVIAVLVDVLSVGFEGPDRHFLAVTATLPE